MGLMPAFYNTTSTRRKKKKALSANQRSAYEVEWRKHNKQMRQKHLHDLQFETLDDYIAYVRGEYKPKSKAQVVTTPYIASGNVRRDDGNSKIPSLVSKDSFAPCTKKERLVYTGERRLVGIATMHKSNMVPVFADEDDKNGSKQATEIATMRRG